MNFSKTFIEDCGGHDLFEAQLSGVVRVTKAGYFNTTCAQSLDYEDPDTNASAAARYRLAAMILIRASGNYLDMQGRKITHRDYSVAGHLYSRAAYAMRQASLAQLYADHTKPRRTRRAVK